MLSLRSTFSAVLFMLLSACGFSLHAANVSLTTSGDFSVPGNWSSGTVPGATDNISVVGGKALTVSDARTVASTTLTGGTLTLISPGVLNTGALTLNLNSFQNVIGGNGDLVVSGAFIATNISAITGNGKLVIASGGTMSVPGALTMTQRNIVVQSGGQLSYTSGVTSNFSLNNSATINVQTGGVFNITSTQPIITSGGGNIVNAGTINYTGSGSISIQVPLSNKGGLAIESGSMNFSAAYTDNGGAIHLGGSIQITALNLTSGLIYGSGTINGDLNQTGGTVLTGAPSSAGMISVNGKYSQGAGGTLYLPVGGTVSNETLGHLSVSSTATLGGKLTIALYNGFVPASTDTFEILQANALAGAFTAVDNGGSTIGPTYQAAVGSPIAPGFVPAEVILKQLANIISVTAVDALPSPARVGGPVTFNSTLANPGTAPLTYMWDFGDGSTGTGTPVTHTFSPTQDTVYNVVVSVFDGQQTASSDVFPLTVMVGNVGGSGANVVQGKSATNPLSGLKVSVTSSDAGLIELDIDEAQQGAQTREAGDAETTFASNTDQFPTRFGHKVVQKFNKSSIYAASTSIKDPATGTVKSKARKTIPVSSREVGQVNSAITEPISSELLTSTLKGKFLFNKAKPDQVTYTGSFEVPGGLDLRESQTLVFAIGNVIDSVMLTPKGKAIVPKPINVIKTLTVKYPKVDRKNPITKAGQIAKLTATYLTADLDIKGFDTEGVTSKVLDTESAKKGADRTIQMAMNLSGVTYQASVQVQFTLTPKADTGMFKTRRAN